MNDTIDFRSVMIHLSLNMRRKYDNYECPFCHKKSFTVYPDEKGYCHTPTCKWSGDSLQLVCDVKNISRNDAYKELGIALKENFIHIKVNEQTYDEAKIELAKDLEFLAWVRMYEGFYDTPYRIDRKILEEKTGLNKSTLSKIINGQVCNAVTWRKTLAVLRSDIDLNRLKKDLKLEDKYFVELLDDEKRGNDIKKYQIKKKRRNKK